MAHKFDPARMGSLTSERRQEAVKPLELLQRAGVQAGEIILDWGCGAGFFAVPAARLVGEAGKVVAVDVQPEMVTATKEAAAKAGLANVEVMAAEEYAIAGRACRLLTGLFWLISCTKCTSPAACWSWPRRL